MDRTCNNLDKIREIIHLTLEWVSSREIAPVVYVAEDHTRVATGARPLLEFGLHSWGSEADLRVGDYTTTSVPGVLAVMNAHFRNFGTPRTAWRFWCLSFDVHDATPVPNIGAVPMLFTAQLSDLDRVARRYETLAREYTLPGKTREQRVKGAALLLLAELLENLPEREGDSRGHSPVVQSGMEWMHRRYRDSELSLGSVAAYVHLSEAHFGRLFRAETGVAPMKYLCGIRMARARELLERTRLTIAEIAREVGYCDPAYFSRIFKAGNGGLSPRQFRRRS